MHTTLYPTHRARPLRRTTFDILALFALLTVLGSILLLAGWSFWHTGRIYTGVSVGGVPVGGLTRAEAYQRLSETLYQFPLPPVMLVFEDQQWPLSTTQVRASADLPCRQSRLPPRTERFAAA